MSLPTLLRVLSVAAVIVTAGCGAGPAVDDAIVSLGSENAASLQLTGDLATTELLNGASGEVTSLGDVVTGDRAVLVWYWAPN